MIALIIFDSSIYVATRRGFSSSICIIIISLKDNYMIYFASCIVLLVIITVTNFATHQIQSPILTFLESWTLLFIKSHAHARQVYFTYIQVVYVKFYYLW